MFYYIKGTLAVLRPGFAAIDCMGVCYRLTVGTRTVAALAQSVGAEVRLFTYLSVREDGVELFGFSDEEERDVFIRLIGVSGVGPKAAVSVLSALSVGQLADCVSSGDAAGIATANGIGMKTAQKIILELKDKLSAVAADASVPAGGAAAEAVNTLVVLGYSRAQATAAVRGVDRSLPLDSMIKEALRTLAKER